MIQCKVKLPIKLARSAYHIRLARILPIALWASHTRSNPKRCQCTW